MTADADSSGDRSVQSLQHRLIVCTTCRREGSTPDSRPDGGALYDTVRALFDAWPGRGGCVLTGVECMSGCNRSCTIGLAAPGKPSYLFGGLAPTEETAVDALALVAQYRDKADGVLERRARPSSFRRGILAKIPSAFSS